MANAANDICTACAGPRNLVSSLYTGITDYCSYDCPRGLLRKTDKTSKIARTLGQTVYRCVPCPADTPFYYVGKCWAVCKNDPPNTIGGMFTVPSTES